MRRIILGLLLIASLLVGFQETQEDTSAASCWADVTSFYKSGGNMYAFGSFGCSGMSGTGKICISGGVCSAVSVPSGTTRSTFTVKQVVCLVDGGAQYSTAGASINGVVKDSATIRRC